MDHFEFYGPPLKEIQHLLNFGFNVSQYLNGWLEEIDLNIKKICRHMDSKVKKFATRV